MIQKGNEKFSGYNKPKRTPNHKTKSHAVLARKADGSTKLVRFGQQGVSGAGKKPSSKKQKARKKSFYARHSAQNGAKLKDRFSPLFWSAKVKW